MKQEQFIHRAFSRQKVQCVKCGAKFRRPLMSDTCPRCRGRSYRLSQRVLSRSISTRPCVWQRIELIGLEIKSLFESDKSKQMGCLILCELTQ